jgi:hypothetical protein
MLDTLGWVVVALLVAPPVLLTVGGVLFFLAGAFRKGPQLARADFECPFKRRHVTVDFVVKEGETHPSDLATCSAFEDPSHVTCRKLCRGLATVQAGLSRGLFPRWSLTAGGPTTYREPSETDRDRPSS